MKYISSLLTLLLVTTISFTQITNTDSLLEVLPDLHDTAAVDCYNSLSIAYILNEKKDSASLYAEMAYHKALQNNYNHGIAISYIRKARIAKHFEDDFNKAEYFAREALSWIERGPNKTGLYEAYSHIMHAVAVQSRFSEALHYAKKMYDLSLKVDDQNGIFVCLARIAAIYKASGNYELSFEYNQRFHQLALKTNNRFQLSNSLFRFAELYMSILDYNSALEYFRKAFRMDTPEFERHRRAEDWDIWVKMEYAEVFSHLNLFDSAWHYFRLFKPDKTQDRYYRIYQVSTGQCYFLQGKYHQALENFLEGLSDHIRLNDQNEIQRTLIFIAKTYLALGQDSTAMVYGRKALQVASHTKAKHIVRDAYQVLYSVYDRSHQQDSANFFFRQYTIAKDSISNEQLKAKLAGFGYDQQIAALDKERQMQKERLSKSRQQQTFLLIAIMGILLLFAITYRNVRLKRKNEANMRDILRNEFQIRQLESEKTNAQLQQHVSELEMQALRAQMNPHFIFNSLNSINRFILQNNKTQASEYLTKFSRLIRLILQNSQQALIPLESEVESLRLYLELEQVRFDHHFEFKVTIEDDLDISSVKVPP